MSFEVFVDSYRDGVPVGISREAVRAIFGNSLSEIDSSCWQVCYDEKNSCDLFLAADADPEKISGFMVSRPCGDLRLWEALISVLRLGAIVLHFEGRVALVADSNAVPHLPKDMLEVFGQPRCIFSGSEIKDAIENG
jgi:hypothetical protein